MDTTNTIGPMTTEQPPRPTPYTRPILLTKDRGRRKKKSITWQPDKSLEQYYYFDLIDDERVNVHKLYAQQEEMNANPNASAAAASAANPQDIPPSALANRTNPMRGGINQANLLNIDGLPSRGAMPIPRSNSNDGVQYSDWKLILIDFTPELPSPGWNSVERFTQAERETYVLGAIDLPGQPSTLDEPDQVNTNGNGGSTNASSNSDEPKIIPLDNPEGMYTEYPSSPPRYQAQDMMMMI